MPGGVCCQNYTPAPPFLPQGSYQLTDRRVRFDLCCWQMEPLMCMLLNTGRTVGVILFAFYRCACGRDPCAGRSARGWFGACSRRDAGARSLSRGAKGSHGISMAQKDKVAPRGYVPLMVLEKAWSGGFCVQYVLGKDLFETCFVCFCVIVSFQAVQCVVIRPPSPFLNRK